MPVNVSTGTEFFVYLTGQNSLLSNFKNDNTRNIIKGTLRFVVASIALGFFAKIGFYYNALLGVGKGMLGVLTLKRNEEKIFGKKSKVFLQEAKLHIVRAIVDLAIATFRFLSILIYAIFPTKMQDTIANVLSRA